MNISICKKLITILFFSLLQSFVGEIKANEICYYYDPISFARCNKDSKNKMMPKYPISTHYPDYFFNYVPMWTGKKPLDYSIPNSKIEIIEINAYEGDSIDIIIGEKKVGVVGLSRKTPFLNERKISIPGEYFISWEYDDPNALKKLKHKSIRFKIRYLNDLGSERFIEFNRLSHGKFAIPENEMLDDLFKEITKLSNGEKRSTEELLMKKFKSTEKNLEIIKTIISSTNSSESLCLKVDKLKFPELIERYKELLTNINPLREKLGLSQIYEVKPICE